MASIGEDEFGKSYWRAASDTSAALPALSSDTIDDASFRLLADNIPTLCWIANGDGYIVWYNRRWHDYCGTTPQEMEGWGWQTVHDPKLLPSVMERWTASIGSGEPFEMTFPLRGRDGVFRPFFTRVQPVRDASGSVARWFGVNTEVSQQHRAEQALRELNETLEQRVVLALSERERIEEQLRQSQKLEAIGQLTGGVAHDFNNLLTDIRGSVDLLRRDNISDEKRRTYIDAIGDTADRAANLTRQLLAFARRQALTPEMIDVGASLIDLATMIRTLTGSRIALETQVPEYPCFIMADRGQLDTAIINMAINARDAMGGEGTLKIATGPVSGIPEVRAHAPVAGDFIAITVADTGGGIAATDFTSIFEPFFTTKAVGQGTGLGLSQVFGFAKQSGGDIRVDSVVGKGTTFTLYLPRFYPHENELLTDVAPAEKVDGEGHCVLVVEDNEQVGAFATQALNELGYDSVFAPSGEAALAELAREGNRFHLVFSDVVMPGMSGLELGAEIRRLYPTVPVILTSGYSHVLAKNGTYGFELLHKPYSVEQLSRVLRKALGWHAKQDPERS